MAEKQERRPTELKTPEFRVSYPHVFKAKYNELGEKYEFTITALFPKDTTDLKPFKKAIAAAVEAQWGAASKAPKSMRYPIKDGDEMDDPNTEGHWVMEFKSSEQFQPVVVGTVKGKDGKFIAITSPKEFYGGCFARAVVNAYAYDMKVNKGVNFGLGNLQKLRDGDRFGGGGSAAAEDDFADTPETDYDSDSGDEADELGF